MSGTPGDVNSYPAAISGIGCLIAIGDAKHRQGIDRKKYPCRAHHPAIRCVLICCCNVWKPMPVLL
jgi:hypothetical protein